MTEKWKAPEEFFSKMIDSPVGGLKLIGNDDGLASIVWAKVRPRRVNLNVVGELSDHPVLLEAEKQLGEYFAGKRQTFDLKFNFHGTEF